MEPIKITQDNFQREVLDAKGTVLVDFWAAWCQPCQMLSPLVDEIAGEVPGLKVGKMSIPCLIVFRDGKAVNQSIGVIPKDAILNLVK